MLPMHNILHPTDFSEQSEAAFRWASTLARNYNSNLIVLHVLPEPLLRGARLPPEMVAITAPPSERWEQIREQLLSVQAPESGVRTFHRLEEGDPAAEILRVADLIRANLIVMGTHGRRGWSRLLKGSVAEHVLQHAACPVLTVRAPQALEASARDAASRQTQAKDLSPESASAPVVVAD